jgi:hypothetical protein
MSQEFEIACPTCNAIFSVPMELAGETAECAECSAIFKIPAPPVVEAQGGLQLPKTDTGAIRGIAAAPDNFDGEVTHTVKLSRTSIGMIPTLKDSFKFDAPPGTAAAPQRPAMAPTASAPARKPMLQRPPSASVAPPPPPPLPMAAAAPTTKAAPPMPPPLPVAGAMPPSVASAQPELPPSHPSATQTRVKLVDVPAWTNIKLRKDEEPLAFHETADSGTGIALLISVPALLAGIGALFKNPAIALVIAGLVWLGTFVVAMFMIRSRGRRGLLMTSQRAIAIGGGKRLEVKK